MEKLSSGSYDLNKWLGGGYDRDVITTFYGPGGSGKTNFCMLAVVHQARMGKKVIFIDTEGGFSLDRFRQLLGKDADSILNNVVLLKPTTFDEQWKAFGRLLKEIKNYVPEQIGCIVVDSIAMLYRLQIAEAEGDKEKIKKVNGVLVRQMRMLAEIARKKNIPILVVNQVYSDFEDKSKVNMVGGDILKYWSKCIIELKREGFKRKAIIRKHRSLPEKEFNFEIVELGIRKKGLF